MHLAKIKYKRMVSITLLAVLYITLQACSSGNTGEFAQYDMPNARSPKANLITAGQPTKDDLIKLAEKGVKVVVNLRAKGEFKGFNEKAVVESLGMKYVHIPMKGGKDITAKNAQILDLALNGLKEPAVVHCASSNRVGGLLAYRAFSIEKLSAKEAFDFGKKAGMRSTSKQVRKLLNY